MIDRRALASLPLFAGASTELVDAVAKRAVEVSIPAGGVLFLAESPPRGWFIVIEGLIRVVRGADGRQHVIHTEGPGGTLGEVPLFTNETHPATGIAAEPTRCALLDRAALEAAMRDAPELGFLLARRLALRVKALVNRIDDRSARSVRDRLIDFLLERQAKAGTPTISMGMTQRDVAEELGTVREVLARELQSLSRAGLIRSCGGGRYELLDLPRLRSGAI
jgi:CRP/FNR family transcriptional regulator